MYVFGTVPSVPTRRRRKKLSDVLAYTLGQGRHEQAIILQAVRSGQPIPKELADRPELLKGLELYFFAFFDLITEKPDTGYGAGKIPWTAKYRYGYEYLELVENDLEDFFYVMNKLENTYEDHNATQRRKEKERKGQNSQKLPPRTPRPHGG